MSFPLIVQSYLSSNEARNEELFRAVNNNLRNPWIESILFMADPNSKSQYMKAIDPIYHKKIHFITMSRRCKYSDMLQQANHWYFRRVVIMANTDIYFDETLNEIDTIDMNGKFLAITRQEPDKKNGWVLFGGDNPEQTQDVWIVRAPVTINAPIELGRPGCENMFANAAKTAKLEVLNPALSVKCYHEHASDIRSWREEKDRVRGTYYFPPVCYINGDPPYVSNYCI